MKALLNTFLVVLSVAGCREVDRYQAGNFVLRNESGHPAELVVYRKATRQEVLRLPLAQPVERKDYRLVIVYPELHYVGDSVRIAFNDGRKLVYSCAPDGTCTQPRNPLELLSYVFSGDDQAPTYTYTITPADYARAQL